MNRPYDEIDQMIDYILDQLDKESPLPRQARRRRAPAAGSYHNLNGVRKKRQKARGAEAGTSTPLNINPARVRRAR
jgi:hypothetical protein